MSVLVKRELMHISAPAL